MPYTISFTQRAAAHAEVSGEIEVVLLTITHPDLAAPIRLSSDPTEKLSLDPLGYGTISGGHQYDFVLMSAVLPDDIEGNPAAASFLFENVDADMAAVLRSIGSPASINIKLVLASAPDTIEIEYNELQAIKGSYDASQVTIDVSRASLSNEQWPAHSMTQRRFPGLYR